MKKLLWMLVPLMCLAAPGAGLAQDTEKAQAEHERKLEQAERQMEEARRKLEEAAREVAELSLKADGDIHVLSRLHRGGQRAMLGINIGGPDDGGGRGVRVAGVTPGGPADLAGLRTGDLIVKIGDVDLAVDSPRESGRRLMKYMRQVEPGSDVALTFQRDDGKIEQIVQLRTKAADAMALTVLGERLEGLFMGSGGHDFDIQVFEDGELPFPPGRDFFRRWGGMEMVSLSPGLGEYFGTDKGILVVRGPDQEGIDIKDGDVILAIDGREPQSPAHATRILRSYQPGDTMKLEIVRKKKKQKLEITLPERKLSWLAPGPARAPQART